MTWDEWQQLTPAQKDAQRDNSGLDNRFDEAYRTGERIEVVYQWGETTEKKRGYVGITTGWKPVYILLNNTRSMGSSDILNSDVITVRHHVSNRTR
jgi:hypothetical protein